MTIPWDDLGGGGGRGWGEQQWNGTSLAEKFVLYCYMYLELVKHLVRWICLDACLLLDGINVNEIWKAGILGKSRTLNEYVDYTLNEFLKTTSFLAWSDWLSSTLEHVHWHPWLQMHILEFSFHSEYYEGILCNIQSSEYLWPTRPTVYALGFSFTTSFRTTPCARNVGELLISPLGNPSLN